jgi:hypothetical protein
MIRLQLISDDSITSNERLNEISKNLRSKITNLELEGKITDFPEHVESGTFYLCIVNDPSKFSELSEKIDVEVKEKVILVDYPIDIGKEFLEKTRFCGLVTRDSVSSWLDESPKKFRKIGYRYGIWGLKKAYNPTLFEAIDFGLLHSENYCLIYNYEIHELDKIIRLYLESLDEAVQKSFAI